MANYPLILIYRNNDELVEKSGWDAIFNAWKNRHMQYEIVENRPYGKMMVKKLLKR